MKKHTSSKIIRIISYNIHKGFRTGNRSFVLKEMKKAIALMNADIVFLQEVQGEHHSRSKKIADWPDEPQFEYLAKDIWPHFSYGKNSVYDNGHHGNAILSRFPIIYSENIDISAHCFESRGMLHAIINIENEALQIHCLCTHLGFFATGRRLQVKRILDRVSKSIPATSPLLIAGDFNDWSQRATRQLESGVGVSEVFCSQHGKHARTYPIQAPLFTLDRIYQRGFEVKVAHVLSNKPWKKLSDHAALYAEVSFQV